jgi:8-oxo-dGTP diphosphatase
MDYPGVAIGVIVVFPQKGLETKVLLGKRKGPLGTGLYSVPGGKVDFGETPIQAVAREVKEETGLDVEHIYFTGKVSNDYFPEQGKHYINLFYTAIAVNPEALHVPESEKEKFDEWVWFDTRELPQNMWMHTRLVIEAEYDIRTTCGISLPGIDYLDNDGKI